MNARRLQIGLAALLLVMPLRANADDFRQTVAAQPGGTLTVELHAGSVEIETDDDHQVEVEASAFGFSLGDPEFRIESDGTDVHLEGLRGGFMSPRVRVRLVIPSRYSVEIRTRGGSIEIGEVSGRVQAETSGGSIEVEEIRGDVELRTSGGRIDVEDVRGNVDAETAGGSIQLSEIYGDVRAHTSAGSIQAHDIAGKAELETSGGSISVRFERRVEGFALTSGGSIDAELPEGVGVDLQAGTFGGRIEIDQEFQVTGQISPGRVEGQINGGGAPLKLETSGGNIRIQAR